MEQSKKLREEESIGNKRGSYLLGVDTTQVDRPATAPAPSGPIKIRPITMYNDWVAVLQAHDEVKGGIEVKKETLARPEGIVVGVNSKGLPDGVGGFTPAQVALGDRVAFQARSVLQGFTPADDSDSPYKGQTIVVISERNIIYKMSGKVNFEIIE